VAGSLGGLPCRLGNGHREGRLSNPTNAGEARWLAGVVGEARRGSGNDLHRELQLNRLRCGRSQLNRPVGEGGRGL